MRCRFWKDCGLYKDTDPVCNVYSGMYYEDHTRPPYCYILNAQKKFKGFKL